MQRRRDGGEVESPPIVLRDLPPICPRWADVDYQPEYLILGALVGFILFPGETTFGLLGWIRDATGWTFLPESGQLGTFEILAPFVALAAGWIGLLYGMALDVQALISRRDGALRLAMVEGSLFETVVYIVCSIFQIVFVRRWFSGKGIIPVYHGGDHSA